MRLLLLIVFNFIFLLNSSARSFDGNASEIIPSSRNLGIGVSTPSSVLHVNGTVLLQDKLKLAEVSAPTNLANYGKVFTNTDSLLYYKDEADNLFLLSNGDFGVANNPSGSQFYIQYHNGSSFGSSASLIWNGDNNYLDIGNTSTITSTVTNSVLIGSSASLTNDDSVAIGYMSNAGATRTLAIGNRNIATGNYSVALGYDGKALGDYASVIGSYLSLANGDYSIAIGRKNYGDPLGAVADYSNSIGYRSNATGIKSQILGYLGTASGENSLAVGHNITSSAKNSAALGQSSEAISSNGFSMGYQSDSSGINALSYGIFADTNNNGAYSIGKGVNSSNVLNITQADSLGIGFNSTIPTLFVENSGSSSNTGNIGIATTSPTAQLHLGSGSPEETLGVDDVYISADLEVDANLYANTFNGTLYGNADALTGIPVTGAENFDDLTDAKTTSTSFYAGSGAGTNDAGLGVGKNTAVGYRALYNADFNSENGSLNTAIGSIALYNQTSGKWNIGFGPNTAPITGDGNISYGDFSFRDNTSGSNNISLGGSFNLFFNTTGDNNLALGLRALQSNTTGNSNIAFGLRAMQENTIGKNNIGIGGIWSLFYNDTGNYNVAFGYAAGMQSVNGSDSVSIGRYSNHVDDSDKNIAIGDGTNYGSSNTGNTESVFIGYQSGYYSKSGSNYSTLVGYRNGYWYLEGEGNTFIGNQINDNIANHTGENNIIIGNSIDTPIITSNSQINIGNSIYGDTNSNVGIADSSPSYKLDVNGTFRCYGKTDSSDIRYKESIEDLESSLEKLTQLRPVKFNWIDKETYGSDREIGFIAQEVEEVYPELVKTDKEGYKSIAYGKISPVIVESIKELKSELDLIKESTCNQYPEEAICRQG